jgi:hypothetical protein
MVGGVTSLATVTSIEGHVYPCGNPAGFTVLPGTVVDAVNKLVQLQLGSWLPTAELGEWSLTWHPTFGDGSKPVWPEEPATDSIIVLA